MTCPACGRANRDEATFCGASGASLSAVLRCPTCGAPNPPDNRLCDSCGHSLAESPAVANGGGQGAARPDGPPRTAAAHPSSFCEGRYEVKGSLGRAARSG